VRCDMSMGSLLSCVAWDGGEGKEVVLLGSKVGTHLLLRSLPFSYRRESHVFC